VRFACLGSGSEGNGLLVEVGATRVLIDCGFGIRDTVARLARIGVAPESIDAIIVTHYLHRALFPSLLGALTDDGVLVYETFARGNEACGKPSNPDFLLAEGELLTVVGNALVVVAFEQGRSGAERPAVVQRLAAIGRRRPWPPELPA